MNRIVSVLLSVLLVAGCKSKSDNKPDVAASEFFPVKDYINGQIARLDTSLYSFQKIETTDSRSDTVLIKNSEVKLYAKDFIDLPDISSPEIKDDYKIEREFDEALEAIVLTFTTKENHPVRSEHVVLEQLQNEEGKNDIKSIFADLWQNKNDVFIRKSMLWEANKAFQITTTIEASGQPQQIKTVKIAWTDFERQTK